MIDNASICPNCGKPNQCLMASGQGTVTDPVDVSNCWCFENVISPSADSSRDSPLPIDVPVDKDLSCYCPACLEKIRNGRSG